MKHFRTNTPNDRLQKKFKGQKIKGINGELRIKNYELPITN